MNNKIIKIKIRKIQDLGDEMDKIQNKMNFFEKKLGELLHTKGI